MQPLALQGPLLARLPKLQLAAVAAVAAVVLSTFAPSLSGPSLGALTDALGSSVGGTVAASDVRWEPSEGPIADYVTGRKVLFLAGESRTAPRDVYRARVQLAPEGRVLGTFGARNLTATPLGDDHALVVLGEHAAFATFVYGQEQTVTWLDLAGEVVSPAATRPDESSADRMTEAITRLEETGSPSGIRRVEVSLVPPAKSVGLAIAPQSGDLQIDWVGDDGKRSAATLDGTRGEFTKGAGELRAEVVRQLPKRFIIWCVDTVRASVGPAPIAWLEEHVFSVRDSLRRATFRAERQAAVPQDTLAEVVAAPPPPLDSTGVQEEKPSWPPAVITSIWKTKEPGEGEWQEPRLPWNAKRDASRASDDRPPPAFYRTFVRPDQDRPYSRVILVAMDTRQLDLQMEAGTEDPKALTGGHGPGRIPRDPAVASRVVAAWNGAFKTEHGNYGMMVNKRILLPPQPNAATVILLKNQRVGFGTWGDTHDVTGVRGIADDDIVSFRQNLDPLVDQGAVNPMGRALWGYTLPGSGMQTERSGLCVTDNGYLLYAWGDDVNGTALGKAFKLAGCSYAMHLDMNPHHTGFIFSDITELRGHNYRSELLTPLMTVSPDRYIEYAPKDFFYVLKHEAAPSPLSGAAFRPDPGTQPTPAWSPAIWSTTLQSGDGAVRITRVEVGRTRFRIRAGSKEPDARTGASPMHELDADDARRVVMAVSLGHALEKRPRGLATDGRLSFPMHGMEDETADGFAALVTDSDGRISIATPREITAIGAHVDFVELPLLALDGVLTSTTKGSTTSAGAALGLTSDGSLLIAQGASASDAALAEALIHAGCRRVVALDRGAHTRPSLQRMGTETSPRVRSEETTLYLMSAPMRPRAFRFDAVTKGAVAQTGATK